jgi:hypothetical protein
VSRKAIRSPASTAGNSASATITSRLQLMPTMSAVWVGGSAARLTTSAFQRLRSKTTSATKISEVSVSTHLSGTGSVWALTWRTRVR